MGIVAYSTWGDWQEFLAENLNRYAIDNDCPPGRFVVSIRFFISREGDLIEANAITNYGFEMETEAMRVICSSPKWIPATLNGRNVLFVHVQSIIFEVCKEQPVTYL
jgi:hypothetical protein